MPLKILAQRGVRLNAGVGSLSKAISPYAGNTTMAYPGIPADSGSLDLKANVYENTLTALSIAWQLGYKVKTDVYTYGVIHQDRFIQRDPSRLIDHMTPEDIGKVNLSTLEELPNDGNRIPSLEELLNEQVRLGKILPWRPCLQLELKKPVDVEKVAGAVMQRMAAGELEASQLCITSFNYDLLMECRRVMEGMAAQQRPQISYLIAPEALDYVTLDRNAPDYKEQLGTLAAGTIPRFFAERFALPDELAAHFPELADKTGEQMQEAIPPLIDQYGLDEFEQRYESYLRLFIGSGMDAGYRLRADALASAPFDLVHIPMDGKYGTAENYKQQLDRTPYRGGVLQAHAHHVCLKGRNPSQLLRAFLILDEDAELSLDYPEMIPQLFAELLASGSSQRDSKMQISFDPTRKRRLDGIEFPVNDLEKASKRFFDLLGISYRKVTGAQALIGGGKNRLKLELDT